VAFDPALGPGHTDQSLRAIGIPTLIVGAVDNDFLPYEHHAGRYARLTQGAKHIPLANVEGHFVFLNEGQSDARANGVAIYRDRGGVTGPAFTKFSPIRYSSFLLPILWPLDHFLNRTDRMRYGQRMEAE
jgi:hypothetical protein